MSCSRTVHRTHLSGYFSPSPPRELQSWTKEDSSIRTNKMELLNPHGIWTSTHFKTVFWKKSGMISLGQQVNPTSSWMQCCGMWTFFLYIFFHTLPPCMLIFYTALFNKRTMDSLKSWQVLENCWPKMTPRCRHSCCCSNAVQAAMVWWCACSHTVLWKDLRAVKGSLWEGPALIVFEKC